MSNDHPEEGEAGVKERSKKGLTGFAQGGEGSLLDKGKSSSPNLRFFSKSQIKE